ncbi:hypothetical protein [uncultured Desulfovibrio sp.]|uniref:hypothetical protein n=1 Tax=uncultured Desulfovibrio sp. TaxID=167968 RepID=UPI002632CBC0|nr:hypothetical protein [uncultured Desulfovibrio sp.]
MALVRDYAEKNGLEMIWEQPLARCADARDTLFARLRERPVPNRYLPEEYLPGARTVIFWFIPFKKAVAASNREGFQLLRRLGRGLSERQRHGHRA